MALATQWPLGHYGVPANGANGGSLYKKAPLIERGFSIIEYVFLTVSLAALRAAARLGKAGGGRFSDRALLP